MKHIIPTLSAALFMAACSSHPGIPENYSQTDELPGIYPDYTNVTIPCNIAPLNFALPEQEAEACVAKVTWKGGSQTYGQGRKVQFPEDEWSDMLAAAKGGDLQIELYADTPEKGWVRFKDFSIHVAPEEIDPYLSYRVISPSYVSYEMLSINQRNLTNFEEKVIYNNMMVGGEANGQCVNCHSYQAYSTDNMQMHMRQGHGGTLIVSDGVARKVNLKTDSTISAGVYPSWHPTRQLIAYSTNHTGQVFHTKDLAKIEVQDTESDLILYDITHNEVRIVSAEPDELEIYPWWSPDGKMLYYASAHFEYTDAYDNREVEIADRHEEVKYDLYRRTFNESTLTFGPADTVYKASDLGKSATLPRISPDGRYLLYTQGAFGCFHIWHKDADLHLIDLQTGENRKLENINSPHTESYHSWSSNGRWIVVSSRRDDGNYTRPYIGYFDQTGKAHKAFAMPQEDPDFYTHYLRSYNIPEFMKEPVKLSPQELAAAVKKEAVKAIQK